MVLWWLGLLGVQGTVLIHNAEELQSYSRGEEDKMEAAIKSIADAGVGVIVSGSAIGEMALHFIEKYNIMAIRIPSKFDLRRFCRHAPLPLHNDMMCSRLFLRAQIKGQLQSSPCLTTAT